jgi:hypothetical protein
MELKSESHRLTLQEATGQFEVWPIAERQLHVTEFRNGQKVRDEIETNPDLAMTKLLAFANRVPLFAANFAGDGSFNIDLDAGFQRWHGTKPEAEVRTALRRCGFTLRQARSVIAAAKIEQHDWLGRYN